MTPVSARKTVVQRLERDLVGPDAIDEVIGKSRRSRPSDFYLTGILWPIGNRMDESDDDGSGDDAEEGDAQSSPGMVGQQRPCSMGLSFATESVSRKHQIDIRITFASYVPQEMENSETNEKELHWKRTPFTFDLRDIPIPVDVSSEQRLEQAGLEADLRLHVRGRVTSSGMIATVSLMNLSRPKPDRVEMERVTLFQVGMEVTPAKGTTLAPRPGTPPIDETSRISNLLFRNCPEFAAGHQCSVGWDAGDRTAVRLWTTWLPNASVPAFREDGHDCFSGVVKEGLFDAQQLGKCDAKELERRLLAVADAYGAWIDLSRMRVSTIPAEMRDTAKSNIKRCVDVLDRIRSNVRELVTNEHMRESFQLGMHAMALQFGWKQALEDAAEGGKKSPAQQLRWRPFQLAFIILASVSTCDRTASDREILDLLWFPTGGGKTEAYLALVAMLAFHRRLSGDKADAGMGNAAVMRYTLRLLTAQQFERAASLILACELIRRKMLAGGRSRDQLGAGPFSIGLWVGGDATPNTFKDAFDSKGGREGSSAEQIETCPCCGSRVRWDYDEIHQKVSPYCETEACVLGPSFGHWPVFTVDTDLYRERPTLVIGTVDKFALMPRKAEIGALFGFRSVQATDLIIQDELHLISGPLGTIAGLYETAFDWLLSKGGKRPKVIGSTATIRRAEDQVRALFDRETCQFPPPGLDHDDSGFAVRDPEKEGRLYVGLTTAGRSAKFILQGAAASLLQSGGPALTSVPEERDGYATLLAYFNSLRELGGAIVQMLDDVPDSIKLYAVRRGESERPLKQPRELTSRASQKEIIGTLADMKRTAADPDCLDVVLATNMVSVGVDVSRLGLMLVNGQPKTRSEYIQSTSRVGRKNFPGLVVSVLNAAKARDRSHYETFPSWHGALYRHVEATSVTPFASRARDRAMHAVLVTMIRHGCKAVENKPNLELVPDATLAEVIAEIERRAGAIDSKEVNALMSELDDRMDDWDVRKPSQYLNDHQSNKSLMQSADRHVRRRAAGLLSGSAWPVMNNMRNVEPSTRVRMVEILRPKRTDMADGASSTGSGVLPVAAPDEVKPARRWRAKNG